MCVCVSLFFLNCLMRPIELGCAYFGDLKSTTFIHPFVLLSFKWMSSTQAPLLLGTSTLLLQPGRAAPPLRLRWTAPHAYNRPLP